MSEELNTVQQEQVASQEEQKPNYEKSWKRINRAVEYVRAHNYPASIVFGIVASEGLKLRIKIWDQELQGDELNETLRELSEFVQYAARESMALPAVETFLYSRGAVFEVVTTDNNGLGVIDPSALVDESGGGGDETE
jgi:hypothetical protein